MSKLSCEFKEEGNEHFKKGEYVKAVDSYSEAIVKLAN